MAAKPAVIAENPEITEEDAPKIEILPMEDAPKTGFPIYLHSESGEQVAVVWRESRRMNREKMMWEPHGRWVERFTSPPKDVVLVPIGWSVLRD